MNWCKLWVDFLSGKPDAVQTVFSVLGFLTTLAGTIYVAITFRQQKDINQEQKEINRLAMEKDRRDLMPGFTIKPVEDAHNLKKVSGDVFALYNKALNVEIFEAKHDLIGKRVYSPLYVAVPEKVITTLTIDVDPQIPSDVFDTKFVITFTDEVGRKYFQRVGYQLNELRCIYPLPQEKEPTLFKKSS